LRDLNRRRWSHVERLGDLVARAALYGDEGRRSRQRPAGLVSLAQYSDFECPYCRAAVPNRYSI
jgi:hypothetical protein